jgi:hypothetical protein
VVCKACGSVVLQQRQAAKPQLRFTSMVRLTISPSEARRRKGPSSSITVSGPGGQRGVSRQQVRLRSEDKGGRAGPATLCLLLRRLAFDSALADEAVAERGRSEFAAE